MAEDDRPPARPSSPRPGVRPQRPSPGAPGPDVRPRPPESPPPARSPLVARRPPVATRAAAPRLGAPARPARSARPAIPALPWGALLLWPVLLSAAVTVLRLAGELLGWSDAHFSRLAGGGLATVGITWLVPFVGFWVGWTLHRRGHRPGNAARAAWQPLVALAAGWAAAALVGRIAHTGWTANLLLWAIVAVVVAAVSVLAWPAAGAALVGYAAAARLAVTAVMALAIARGWGTHYDAVPPGFPPMGRLPRFLLLGLLPQATIWVAFTVAVGLVFAALGRAVAARRSPQ